MIRTVFRFPDDNDDFSCMSAYVPRMGEQVLFDSEVYIVSQVRSILGPDTLSGTIVFLEISGY